MPKTNRSPSPEPDDPEQSQAFLEKARELEANGDASKGDLLMSRLAKTKPEPRAKTIKGQTK